MSEQTSKHELIANHESQIEQTKSSEQIKATAEQDISPTAESLPTIEEARKKALEHAKSSSETTSLAERAPDKASPAFVNHDLKVIARNRLLKQVRENLPKNQRVFSHIIHHPVVDNISELTGKTIGRPSGLLAGGICALLGSSTFLYIAKHYGYRYNFLLWVIFFVGGFIVGLILEAVVALFRRLKSR
jgi:hypothetical protein